MGQRIDSAAIAIQRFPYAETSLVVHFLTESHGRLVALVRGAFREKNSYEGPIDLLVQGRVRVALVHGRELGLLLRRRVEDAFPRVRRDAARFVAASGALRLLVETVPVGQGDAGLYQLFQRFLSAAEEVERVRLPLLSLSFELRLLRWLGLEPCLEGCVRCGAVASFAAFAAGEGGILCRRCAASRQAGFPVREATRSLLCALATRPLKDVELPPAAVVESARRLLDHHWGYHLDWPTPTPRRWPVKAPRGRRQRA